MKRKALCTEAEINAAYPEHVKKRGLEPQIKLLEDFMRALEKADIHLCRKYIHDEEDGDGKSIHWYPADDLKYQSHGMQDFIWKALGLNPNTIWAEKSDMIDQLGLAFEDSKTAKTVHYVACYGNGGDDDAPDYPFINRVEDLTYNPDGSPAWPDSVSAHETYEEAAIVLIRYVAKLINQESEVS